MLRAPTVLAIGLLVGLPLLAGCGAIFGQRYANFTAYYNTFYNAQRDFERAERDILRADEVVDRTQFLSLFPKGARGRGGGGQQGFEAAIRRAADVLRDHPGTKWVDDALLLIGKAYFYQGNFDAAAQKFREVLTLEKGRVTDEANLWLGRSLMEAHHYGDAAAVLREALTRENLDRRWAPKMRLALAENDLRRGDLQAAAEGLQSGLEQTDDGALAARAAFLLGQVFDALSRYEEAADAYAHALALRPNPGLTFALELQRTLALSRSGRTDDALARLERLRRDDRFFQQRAEVELMRARAYVAAGRPDEAHDLLHRLLYQRDASLRIDGVRGPIHYRLAEIYRDDLRDLTRAAAHFDTAATAMRPAVAAAREIQTTREAVLDADRLAESHGTYARVHARIVEMDSLLYLGALDDDAFAEAIEAIAEQRRQDALVAQRERRRIEDQQGFGQASVGGGPPVGGQTGAPPESGEGSAGFLNFRNPVRVQEALVAFQSRWGDRPRVPNWRRRAAVTATVASGEAIGEEQLDALIEAAESPLDALVDISGIPRSSEAYQHMRGERAVARYELANVLFLTLEDPHAAAEWYRLVIDQDDDLPVAVRARFALAEVYDSQGNAERAETYLEQISELSDDDPLVRAASARLGRPAPPPPPDSLELARRQYEAAFRHWEEGRLREAFQGMMGVDADFPALEMAGRARLAAGMIYTQWAAPDTTAVLALRPDRLFAPSDSLFGDPVLLALDPNDAQHDAPPGRSSASDSDGSADVEPGHDGADSADPEDETASHSIPNQEQPSAGAVGVPDHDEPIDVGGSSGSVLLPHELVASEGHSDADTDGSDQTAEILEPGAALAVGDTTSAMVEPLEGHDGSPAGEEIDGDPVSTRSWLEDLYASIEQDFPGTPFAQRAARLRAVVEEQRMALIPEPAEPEAVGPAEAPDPGAVPESFEVPDGAQAPPSDPSSDGQVDGAALATRYPADAPAGPSEAPAMMGEEPVRAEAGGFSWAALVTERMMEAQNRLMAFHNSGYRTALLTRSDEGGESYIVLVGQFATESDARAARAALPLGADQGQAEILPITPDLNLESAEDLLAH